MNKKYIVFDMDDTISDAYQFNQDMFINTFKPYLSSHDLSREQYLRNLHYQSRGSSMLGQFKTACTHLKLRLSPERLVAENERLHVINIHQVRIFSQSRNLLTKLKSQGKELSICTNRQTKSLEEILKQNNLAALFTNVISCSDMGHEKPDPYCLNLLVKKSSSPKRNFLYIGDSPTDSQFAKNAGIQSIIIDHYQNQKNFYKNLLFLI